LSQQELPSTREINRSYVLFLGATAALGGLLFGFDIAIITGAGPFLAQEFHLSELGLGWAFSSLLFGCVIGSAVTGRLTDSLGRLVMMRWVAVLFAITSLATGLATSFTLFIVARFIGGLAVGGASILAPMYVAEVSPPTMRGRMGTLYQLSIVAGVVISYCINYGLRDEGPWNWRWMFISGMIPSIIFFLLLVKAPETPRYLYKSGRKSEAFALLKRILGQQEAERELAEIDASLTGTKGSIHELMQPELRRVLAVSFCLAILVHLCGINTIVDYAPQIFQSAGFKMDAALFSTFIIGLTMAVATLVSFWIIDRYGRKPLYIVGSLGMTVALLALIASVAAGKFHGVLVLGLIMLYIAFFASCIGPVFWTVIPEIIPNRIRGTAMAVPVLTQWVANAFVVLFFPYAFSKIGKTPTFSFLALMCLIQMIFVWKLVPETRGKTLEEIEELWH
jgi:SP family arabinose:H+ symporter-like MFS transporter